MGIEIERKFLVRSDAWKKQTTHSKQMTQGYFQSPDATIRVRIIDQKAILTIKGGTEGLTRSEWEYPIPYADAVELVDAFCGDRVLSKTRHYVVHDGHTFEVDLFEGKLTGLTIAELELVSEDTLFSKPDWLGAEVSGDARYYNEVLVKSGEIPS